MARPKKPDLLPPGEPLPAGTKEVRRTTVERYTQDASDTQDDSEGEFHAGSNGRAEPDDELSAIGLTDDDDTESESVEDKFVRSLRDGSDSGGNLRIFARRVPDPVGLVFKHPCKTEYTAGEVPYDPSDLTVEGIELAIQSLFGGGRYQIIAKRSGDYAGARTRNIMDAPEKKPEPAPLPPSNNPPAPVPRPGMDELKNSISLVKEVLSMVHSEGAAPRNTLPPAPPPDPVQTTRDALGLLKELRELVPAGGESGGGGTGNTVRDVLDGISGLAKSFGIGQVVNNLVAFGLSEAARKRASENGGQGSVPQDGTQPPATPAPPSSVYTEPIPDVPQGALDQAPGPVQPPGFALDALPPPLRVALEKMLDVVVAEIHRNEVLEENDISAAVDALNAFVVEYPFAFEKIDELMGQSSVKLHISLSQIKPEYATLLDLDDATGFLAEVKREWAEGKAAALAESADESENEK